MAQVSRRHHFVSNCYLSRFTDTGTKHGRLCVLDLIASRCFKQKPKNVAYERDFNRVDIEGHPPDVLESAFGEFEGEMAEVIRKICSNEQLPEDEEFSYVVNLIALLAVRNPAMRRSMTMALQQEYRILTELLQSDPGLYERHVRLAREGGFISGTKDIPFEQFRRGTYRFEISPQQHILTEMGAFKGILPSLGARHWSLLVAAPGAPDFVTCDHPVSLVYKQVVFPLDTRHAVIGDRERPMPPVIRVTAAGVAEVNTRILTLAERHVFSQSAEVTFLDGGDIVNGPLAAVRRSHD